MIALDLSLATPRAAATFRPVAPGALVSRVNADGWSAEWAEGEPPVLVPDADPRTVTVRRAGHDADGRATTHVERRVATRRRRRTYPDQASDMPRTVALDDYVYATDVVPGADNVSEEASPRPVAAWTMPARLLVADRVDWEIVAFHRDFRDNRQVACVRVRATDGAAATAWQTVSATTLSTLAEDADPIEVYAGEIDVAALATGPFWLEAEVLPWIGTAASILRSEDHGGAREFSRRWFLRDPARAAAPPLAYVAGGGDDAAGVWSVTPADAATRPFRTVGGALTAATDAARGAPATGGTLDGARIRIVDAVALGIVATARPQKAAAVVIERAPDTPRAQAVVTLAAAFRPRLGVGTLASPLGEGALLFRDVTIARTANTTFSGEAATPLALSFWNVAMANGGVAGTIHASSHGQWFGGVWSGYAGNLAGTAEQRLLRGVSIDLGRTVIQYWVTIGCRLARPTTPVFANPAKGAIFYANRFLDPDPTTSPIQIDTATAGETIEGMAIVQNLIEVTHATSSSASLRISSDDAGAHTAHVVIAYNTVTGYAGAGRSNLFYDESVQDAVRRSHRLMRDVGNIYVQLNSKGDVWVGGNQQRAAEAANRTGQLAYAHGVGCQGNWTQYRVASGAFANEEQTYPGRGARIGRSPIAPRAAPAAIWRDYRGTTGSEGIPVAGAGGGDYALADGSPVRGLVATPGLAYDLAGARRPATGDAAGAYR